MWLLLVCKEIILILCKEVHLKFGLENEERRKLWLSHALSSIKSDLSILDAGAGELRNKEYCKHLKYVSQDFCQYEGVGDSKGLQMGSWDTRKIDIVSDICSIPVPDSSFDVLLCSEVLEHLPDPVAAIHEFSRILKIGGELILTAPFASLTHFSPFHYSTGFNRYFYEKHLKDTGFEIEEILSNGSFFEFLAQEVYRTEGMTNSYSNHKFGYFDRKIVQLFIKLLERIGVSDKGSSQVLCFGYNVKAKKIK